MIEFDRFILRKENVAYLSIALAVGSIYFIILRLLFSVPSYFPDSYTYIQVARDHSAISFRPPGYAEIINFFKIFSTSDVALIAGQYIGNLLANLFLFFSFTWLFPFKKSFKIIFFAAVVCNPLYVFYSNYILADSFFSAFTILWFALLLWIIRRPSWYLAGIQLLVLAFLFRLRYNAVIFPVFAGLAFLFSPQAVWKKLLNIAAAFVLILFLAVQTVHKTERYTGVKTFSAFSGWQLANNALHILRHEKVDTTVITSEETRRIIAISKKYFDTARVLYNPSMVTSNFMWDKKSPLRTYMVQFAIRKHKNRYLEVWTSLGPVYNDFGKAVIFQKPLGYVRCFVLPNARSYFLAELEAYKAYCQNIDTLDPIAKVFFGYKTNKLGPQHSRIYAFVFQPWRYFFPSLNVLFVVLAIVYLLTKKYRTSSLLFNQVLLCFSAFYLANFFFVVLLAPSVFRYYVFIITLLFPFILLLWQKITGVEPVPIPATEETDR